MRRWIVGLVVAAAACVPVVATAGNQQVAEQIAAALRDSGKLHGYRIGVKYQDGTVWLKGQVATQEEMATALDLAFSVPGVTRVMNHLTIQPIQPVEGGVKHTVENQAVAGTVPANLPTPTASQTAAQPVTPGPTSQPAPEVANVPARLNLAPMRLKQDERIQRTAVEEPTLAPLNMEVAKEALPPKPIPTGGYQPPLPMARTNGAVPSQMPMAIPMGAAPARYDQPNVPNYAWPSYAPYPNYAAVTYPKQYSPTAWPYIGPFYPYPQVPLGWRKVTLEWHDGWWALDFDDGSAKGPFSGLYRPGRRKY